MDKIILIIFFLFSSITKISIKSIFVIRINPTIPLQYSDPKKLILSTTIRHYDLIDLIYPIYLIQVKEDIERSKSIDGSTKGNYI